jgi:plasmid stabilization system protein ParE
MTKPVRFSREAREDVLEAARWYSERRPELRAEFLADLDEAIDQVARYAHHLGSPPGIDPALGVRRVFFKRFPYSVFFVELPTRYRVLAVAHARRRPFYWRRRI